MNKVIDCLKLMRLDKPIGTLLLLYPTLWALWITSYGNPKMLLVIVFVVGVFLTRASGCVINDYADIEFDKHVERTKNRPLTTGRISKKSALLLFLALNTCAITTALIFLHWQTILLSIPALIILITYPYMKRYISLPQAYLGVAFSFGILMVSMETIKSLNNYNVWLLFFANLFWTLGYDTIYAMVDIKDDLKIGIKTSAITFGRYIISAVAICYVLFILFMVLVGVNSYLYISPFSYFYWISLATGSILLFIQIWILITKQKKYYFKMFLQNNWVGLIISFGIITTSLRF